MIAKSVYWIRRCVGDVCTCNGIVVTVVVAVIAVVAVVAVIVVIVGGVGIGIDA